MDEDLIPAVIVRPGDILRRELEARGWTQADLAEIMGRPEQAVSEIITGKKQITAETAVELGHALGTSAELWSNLEANYQLDLARSRVRSGPIGTRRQLYSLLPVREMVKRGWIALCGEATELERQVLRFLDLRSLDAQPSLAARFRHTTVREPNVYAQAAWVRRVEQIALRHKAGDFSKKRLAASIPSLLERASHPEDVALLPEALSRLGIHLVLLPHLPGTYLDGAAFYHEGRPVLALTLRYDRIDAFWFTLLHELAHLIEEREGAYLDRLFGDAAVNAGDQIDEEVLDDAELAANRMARDWLIDPAAFSEFRESAGPLFSKASIEAFAGSQQRHPGIVLGRLQHEGLVPFNRHRGLLVKVSPFLRDHIAA